MADKLTGFAMATDPNANEIPVPKCGGTIINVDGSGGTTQSAVIDATYVRVVKLTAYSGNVYLAYGTNPTAANTTEILLSNATAEYYIPAGFKIAALGKVQIQVYPNTV